MRPQEIIERGLASSTVSSAIVIVRERSAVNLRWAANTLTTNGTMRSRDVTVVSCVDRVDGTSVGVKSGVVAEQDDLDRLVQQSEASARAAAAAPDANPLVAASASADFDEAAEETSAAVFGRLAPELGEAFGRAAAERRELFGYVEHDVTTTFLGSTTGLRLRHVQPTGRFDMTGKSHARTRSTWVGAQTRDFQDVDVAALDADVARRLGWAARQVSLDPGRYDVVIPPVAVADLMVYVYWTAGGRDAAEGRTVFSRPGGDTRIGDPLTPVPLTLFSDPAYPSMECEPFVVAEASSPMSSVFDNGMPLERSEWISQGRLNALLQTRHSAALTSLPVTPPIDNLALVHAEGSGDLMDLVSKVERGLLLTTLWYIREVDPQTLLLTGLTRDGVYLVEGGEVVGAANNFRFNESPVDLLSRVTSATETHRTLTREWSDFFTRTAMPGVRVSDFNMSTVSQAS